MRGPSHQVRRPVGRLRIEEVETATALPQILQLRATTLGRRISLAPDIRAWGDPLDVHASHWCVFRDHALAAAARLSILADTEGPLDDAWPRPAAFMSHCVVDARFEGQELDAMLDAARIERARQMRCATLVATPESTERAGTLAALGFKASARAGVLVLDLAREAKPASAIARHPRAG